MNGTAAVGATVNLDSSTTGPSVTITSPLNGTVDSNGSSLTLSAQAGGVGAAITSVQFMDGTNSLGSVNAPPFMLNYSGLGAGSHTITAVATDANGLSTTSAPVNVTISGDGTSAPPPATSRTKA
jgi:chitinase